MIKPKVKEIMNEQIKHELESYYLYLSMVAYFHDQSLDGMANWMRGQAHEEMVHAMKLFDHIIDRGGEVKLLDLKQHKTEWSSPLEAWEDAYEHEQFISDKINKIYDVVREEKDYAAEPIVNWFVDEQIEEEANTSKIAEQMKRIEKTQGGGLYMLDKELGARAFPAGSPLDQAAYSAEGGGE